MNNKNKAVGFTGTSHKPLTPYQRLTLETELRNAWHEGYREFHHGDCVHADSEADGIAWDIGFNIVIHPPLNPYKRAFCAAYHPDGRDRIVILPMKPYLERNHDIVNATSRMLACPQEHEEQLRSGTWATIRYARKNGNMWHIIYPTP